jgi:hypothetical protein
MDGGGEERAMTKIHYIAIAKNFIMKKIPAVILAFTFLNVAIAQTADTSFRNHLKPDIIDNSWCISVNAGLQKRLFFGAGIARTSFSGSGHGIYGSDIYAGVNIFPAFKKLHDPVTGIKLGADFFGSAFFMGAEVQYLKAKGVEEWLFTPRAGIGISYLYLAYGYSIPRNTFPVAGISQNSISLQVNFPFYSKDRLTNKVTHWGKKKKR